MWGESWLTSHHPFCQWRWDATHAILWSTVEEGVRWVQGQILPTLLPKSGWWNTIQYMVRNLYCINQTIFFRKIHYTMEGKETPISVSYCFIAKIQSDMQYAGGISLYTTHILHILAHRIISPPFHEPWRCMDTVRRPPNIHWQEYADCISNTIKRYIWPNIVLARHCFYWWDASNSLLQSTVEEDLRLVKAQIPTQLLLVKVGWKWHPPIKYSRGGCDMISGSHPKFPAAHQSGLQSTPSSVKAKELK